MIEKQVLAWPVTRKPVLLALTLGVTWASSLQAQPKNATSPTISAASYRARLVAADARIKELEKQHPRPLLKITKNLDTTLLVRRADGDLQTVTGNQWSRLNAGLSKPQDVRREEVLRAHEIAQSQLRALDEWTKQPVFTSVDAQKIVADLEKSGQIRVGPLWWQAALSKAWKVVTHAWKTFSDWINSLLPKPRISPSVAAPSDKWLWILFYFVVAAIFVAVAWFVFRAFGGSFGRQKVRPTAALEGEDAQLLLLPPDELRLRAEEFAAQGQFREALRHRYLALLLQLDARSVWRYDARRTNWEHIAALRRTETQRALVPELSDLTRRFDRVRYGGAPCDASQWNVFSRDSLDLEARVQNGAKNRTTC